MALPLISGLTETNRDADPLAFRLADVLARNPALMLEDPEGIMRVIGRMADNRQTAAAKYHAAITNLEGSFDVEADPAARAHVAHMILELRGDEDETSE